MRERVRGRRVEKKFGGKDAGWQEGERGHGKIASAKDRVSAVGRADAGAGPMDTTQGRVRAAALTFAHKQLVETAGLRA